MTGIDITWPLVDLLLAFNIFLIMIVVVFERRKPTATLVWILTLVFLPLLGFLVYIFLGQNLRRERKFRLKKEEEQRILPFITRQDSELHHHTLNFKDHRVALYEDIIHLHLKTNQSLLTQDNKIRIFYDGNELFDCMLESLRAARRYIHLEFFIIRDDHLGREVMQILSDKARQGVEVKFLYDGMGCIRLRRRFFQNFHHSGGNSVAFFPPFLPYINLRINFRNHRKICIIDGKEAFVGGFNIGDEYRGLSPDLGYWRDTHLLIKGSAVNSLEMRFLLDWRFAAPKDITDWTTYLPEQVEYGNTAVQIVSSGPDLPHAAIKHGYQKLISKAQRTLYIATPYFIPNESILEALKVAALSGVDVRLMIPFRADHIFAHWASLSYVGELLWAGVRCFQYRRGFLHSKFIVADSFASTVGTANLDNRSFYLNFEVNAFIYDEKIGQKLQEQFLSDMGDCTEMQLGDYVNRPFSARMKEGFFRLLSPLL